MKNKQNRTMIIMGIVIMILLTLTKVVPSTNLAGYSVFVGIVFFFITEVVSKTPKDESGLRFNTIVADLKKPGVGVWILLPMVSGLVTLVVGNLIFGGDFVTHVMGRTSTLLSFDQIALLIGQVIIAAFGEEIAFRGFFFGKGKTLFPIWVSAVISSVVFAAGHIAIGNIGIVTYDIVTIFIDSLLFSIIYYKSDNCVISTISHILANALSITVVLLFF